MKKINATMAGTVIQILVQVGEQVTVGQDVIMLESMKMEVPQTAEMSGTVKEIRVSIGDFVNESDLLIVLE